MEQHPTFKALHLATLVRSLGESYLNGELGQREVPTATKEIGCGAGNPTSQGLSFTAKSQLTTCPHSAQRASNSIELISGSGHIGSKSS